MIRRTTQSDFSWGVTATHNYHVFFLGSVWLCWSSRTRRLYPSPSFTSIFLCQGEGSENHTCFSFSLSSEELIASGWTIFHISEHWHCTWHNGWAGYGTRRGAHNGKQVFMVTQVEAARQRHLPCLQSKPLAGELEFWARKLWEKLRTRAKKGGKDCGETKVCSGLSSQRKTKKQEIQAEYRRLIQLLFAK